MIIKEIIILGGEKFPYCETPGPHSGKLFETLPKSIEFFEKAGLEFVDLVVIEPCAAFQGQGRIYLKFQKRRQE